MLSGAVTNRYTQGLFQAAEAHGVIAVVDQNLKLLSEALRGHSELKSLIEHPVISVEEKVKIVENVFGEHLEPLVIRFLRILFARRRSAYVQVVYTHFHTLAEEARGRVTVEVESAFPMDEEQTRRIAERISLVLNKEANVVIRVNPDLVAGYRAKVGNRVLDATVRGALEQFSQKLSVGGVGDVPTARLAP